MSSDCEIELKDNQASIVVFTENDVIEVNDVGVRGEPGPLGPAGIISGQGAPNNLIGFDQQSYIDALTGDFYQKISGSWVLIGSLKGAEGETNFKIETITLNSDQISAKAIILNETPSPPEKTIVSVQHAPTQYYGIDFVVSGNTLHWEGLSFELLLEVGSKIIIQYLT